MLCRGEHVVLAWPEEHEFDAMTALRNRPAVRERFMDPRPLDVAANRAWLRHGMRRPVEGLLAIRTCTDAALLGMIGWSKWDRREGALEMGRLVLDAGAVRRYPELRAETYPGVAIDAVLALRDLLFEVLGLRVMRSVYLADNAQARRVNALCGAREVRVEPAVRPDGSVVELVHLEMTRAEWARQTGRGRA